MKSAVSAFLICIALSAIAFGVEIKPTNISIPSPGGIFSFDFVVNTPIGQEAQFVQLTIDNVSGGPADLTFDTSASEAVEMNPDYWAFGNSIGATAQSLPGGSYSFDDGANNPPTATINDKILARFAFIWDGTVDDYTFTLDLNIDNSYVYLDNFQSSPITLPTGQWYTEPIIGATDSIFTIHIPEPATMLFLSLGGIFVLKRRKK